METMKKVIVMMAAVALSMFILSGCDKEEANGHAGHDHGTEMHPESDNHEGHDHAEHAEEAKEMVSAGEQTICPVMGNPINKELFTEYKGKKVYFCCPGCDKLFNEDPEKYLSKLPQFGGKEESK